MPSKVEGQHFAEFLLSEANGWRSRDTVTVTVQPGVTLPAGRVLEASSGKYVTLVTSGNAAAILLGEIVNSGVSTADFEGAVVNRHAEVRLASLSWPTGWVAANWTASLTALLALGIKVRP